MRAEVQRVLTNVVKLGQAKVLLVEEELRMHKFEFSKVTFDLAQLADLQTRTSCSR